MRGQTKSFSDTGLEINGFSTNHLTDSFSDQVQYPNRGDIAQELFGNRAARAIVDWSCSLGHLVSQLPIGHGYTVDTLIDDYTRWREIDA
jgi:hypothetical protein